MWSIYCVYISKWSLWKPGSLLAHKAKHYNSAGSLSLICGQGFSLLRGCCRYFCSPVLMEQFCSSTFDPAEAWPAGSFHFCNLDLSLLKRNRAGCHGLHCRYLIILDYQAFDELMFPFWWTSEYFIDRLCTYWYREEQSVCVAGERKFGPGTERSVSVL